MAATDAMLFIGDVFGKPGRKVLKTQLAGLQNRHALSGVVANIENAAGSIGVTPGIAREFLGLGVDVLTSGNHIWRYRDILPWLENEPRLLRPLNHPEGTPGRGLVVHQNAAGLRIAVMNLQGRVFMEALDCPFQVADRALESVKLGRDADVFLVDFHAEATSEKTALAHYLDGRVTAVVGTHTHVPTADARVLPGGTGYITDVGMTGAYDSIIGMRPDSVMPRFLTGMPTRFEPAAGEATLCGVIIDLDRHSGRCLGMRPVRACGTLAPAGEEETGGVG